MSKKELIQAIEALQNEIETSVSIIERASLEAQKAIYNSILEMVQGFEISDGRYVVNQNFRRRLMIMQQNIEGILGGIFIPSVSEYLNVYTTIEQTNISLQKSYNDLEVSLSYLTPARRTVYDTAEYFLTKGLNDVYVQPAKYLLMQQVTSGLRIEDSRKVLREWNEGKTVGTIMEVPNLERYAVQLSRDSAYQFDGAINSIIAEQYNLDKFIYVGGVIEGSRPLCKHLVGLERDIAFNELPELIKKYPQGLYPNTNKDNFLTYRGGYSCRHTAYAVK